MNLLVFATEFMASSGATAEQFLDICQKWLIGGPRYPWNVDDFNKLISVNEVMEVQRDAYEISYALVDGGSRIAALQHRYTENNYNWVTELVGGETNGSLLVSIRVHCTALITGLEIPWARKPYIIRLIIQQLGGGQDGSFTIGENPHFLKENEMEIAIACLSGRMGNRLPVVYVSSKIDGSLPLDVYTLSKWLSGMAHVVVEPSREFSYRLMPRVDCGTVYGGAIGLYWPDGTAFEKTFVGARGPESTARYLESRVQDALCQSQPTDLSTWMAVRALLASKRVRTLKESGTRDVDEWIDAFEEENNLLRDQLAEANSQIAMLSSHARASTTSIQDGGLILSGREQDLFPGERLEIVQSALKEALSKTGEESRSHHVLSDLIPKESIDMRGSLSTSVRSALQNKTSIGSKEINELKGLGFEISEEGKHYKAVFRGDPRYSFSIHKTASDHRAPANLISTINRTLFK